MRCALGLTTAACSLLLAACGPGTPTERADDAAFPLVNAVRCVTGGVCADEDGHILFADYREPTLEVWSFQLFEDSPGRKDVRVHFYEGDGEPCPAEPWGEVSVDGVALDNEGWAHGSPACPMVMGSLPQERHGELSTEAHHLTVTDGETTFEVDAPPFTAARTWSLAGSSTVARGETIFFHQQEADLYSIGVLELRWAEDDTELLLGARMLDDGIEVTVPDDARLGPGELYLRILARPEPTSCPAPLTCNIKVHMEAAVDLEIVDGP